MGTTTDTRWGSVLLMQHWFFEISIILQSYSSFAYYLKTDDEKYVRSLCQVAGYDKKLGGGNKGSFIPQVSRFTHYFMYAYPERVF